MTPNPTAKSTSKTKFRVWLPIVACLLGGMAGRYVGKYVFSASVHITGDPPLVRGALYDNITWGEIYGGAGALIAALIVGLKGQRWKPWRALAVSLLCGVLFAAFMLIKSG